MIRNALLLIALSAPLQAFGQSPQQASPRPVDVATPPPAPAPVARDPSALPPMYFLSSVLSDDVFDALKQNPALSALDKDLPGSPLTLLVTHTTRVTSGGQAAGLLTAFLSGSTLGLIPMVSNDELVVRYEVMLNNKPIATYSFSRTATRAFNLWAAGSDAGALGKAGTEWVKSTAKEAAVKMAADPALASLRSEIAFYFAAEPTSSAK